MKRESGYFKIHSKRVFRKYDTAFMPEIRLNGKWLQDLGFAEGKRIKIQKEMGKLILTLEE